MIITIDGPSGTGKSTIAKKIANLLCFEYFDTGSMYRSMAYLFIQKNIEDINPEKLKILWNDFDYKIVKKNNEKFYFLGDEDITDKIRTEKISKKASQIATNPLIRSKMVELQRHFASNNDCVFEGRDMGTVVFPNAGLKIFLIADSEERAKRRFLQLKGKFQNINFDKIYEDIQKRDKMDCERKVSPLKCPDDAIVVDTTHLTIDKVIEEIIKKGQLSEKKKNEGNI